MGDCDAFIRRQRKQGPQPLDDQPRRHRQIERHRLGHPVVTQVLEFPRPASVPVTRSACTSRKRALNRIGLSGGVTARQRYSMPSRCGGLPSRGPVSSSSSRAAAMPSPRASCSLAALRSVPGVCGGRSVALGAERSARSTAPPGNTRRFGMKRCFAPRMPISISGSPRAATARRCWRHGARARSSDAAAALIDQRCAMDVVFRQVRTLGF